MLGKQQISFQSLRVVDLAWRWDRNVLIKIDHTANKQPERMVKRLPQLGESKEGCICLSVHHPQYVRRLLGVKRKIKIEKKKKRLYFCHYTEVTYCLEHMRLLHC